MPLMSLLIEIMGKTSAKPMGRRGGRETPHRPPFSIEQKAKQGHCPEDH